MGLYADHSSLPMCSDFMINVLLVFVFVDYENKKVNSIFSIFNFIPTMALFFAPIHKRDSVR